MVFKKKKKKDLDFTIGTKEEAYWTEVLVQSKIQIENLEKALKLQVGIKELAESKIAGEKMRDQDII
jgi:hypothetical protein